MAIKLKRAYEKPAADDGMRVLVDRLWPRGLTKQEAQIDVWLKHAAPSAELRKWFNHDPAKWGDFKKRFFRELAGHADLLEPIRKEARKGTVTLVFGSKEERYNNAAALKDYLLKKA